MKNFIRSFIFLLVLTATFALTANAQQTIFNVPSADVLDRGKVYAELDAAFKTNNQDALRRFSSFTPRVVAGAGGKVEVGLNVTGNIQPGADATTLVPAVKWKFYENRKKDFAVFAGNNFYIPVRNRAYNFGSYTYAAAAKTIRKTRLTAGGYVYSKNVVAQNAARAGGQFAVEQTVDSKLTVAADWITGKQANGYFTPGAIYKPTQKVTAYFAYSLGNANLRQGNHFFLFEIGYNFN